MSRPHLPDGVSTAPSLAPTQYPPCYAHTNSPIPKDALVKWGVTDRHWIGRGKGGWCQEVAGGASVERTGNL